LLSVLGDLASIIGLLIALVGFVATILNVTRARRAAEDARQAAREAVARIGSQLLSNEVGTSLQLVREVDAACRDRNWSGAIYRCDEVRTRLAHLLEHRGLAVDESDIIRSAIADFGRMMSEVQRLRAAQGPKDVTPRVTKRLHEIIIALGQIRGRLQAESLEV
jgi:hypothetical protein